MRVKANFHFQDIGPIEIPNGFLPWLKSISEDYQKAFSINYVFCSDEYLLKINQDHLNHDYYTDIITFDLSTVTNRVESDIFISLDRIRDNAKQENSSFAQELSRVMAHGVFHLIGFGDKTGREALKMRELENKAIKYIL